MPRVLIVDDSSVVRSTLSSLLEQDPELEVIGAASDPYEAVAMMRQVAPDVIVLDLEMPRMDGLTFLRRLMAQHPLPVVVCTSMSSRTGEYGLRALEAGALDVIEKPRLGAKRFLEESSVRIIDAVKGAAAARIDYRPTVTACEWRAAPRTTSSCASSSGRRLIVTGSSTGGIVALRALLAGLPLDAPPLVAVQHISRGFTAELARRTNDLCRIEVVEGRDGMRLKAGQAVIAPADRHTLVHRIHEGYLLEVREGPLVSRHRPSVDVLFSSAAEAAGACGIGVLMTGMGDDGARGLLEMWKAGAHTIAQDESTSVVYGMPKVAVTLGAVCEQAPLTGLADAVMAAVKR